MKYAMFFISALIITILSGCEHQGNNPPEENPLEGYTVLQADDDNVHLSVYVDTVENWTILKWYIDAVDSAEHEYTVGNEVVFYSVVTDIPSHLDVAYGNQEVLLIDMYGHMAGENPDYAYELEYKFTMQNKVKYYLLYKGEMEKYTEYGEYFY